MVINVNVPTLKFTVFSANNFPLRGQSSTMKTILFIAIWACIIPFSAYSFNSSDINMSAGLWEITTTIEIANMSVSIPPTVSTTCLTKENLIPDDENRELVNNCLLSDQTISNDTVSWKLVCDSEEGKMTGSGPITYKKNRFNGTVRIQIPTIGAITQQMTGQRIGNCN